MAFIPVQWGWLWEVLGQTVLRIFWQPIFRRSRRSRPDPVKEMLAAPGKANQEPSLCQPTCQLAFLHTANTPESPLRPKPIWSDSTILEKWLSIRRKDMRQLKCNPPQPNRPFSVSFPPTSFSWWCSAVSDVIRWNKKNWYFSHLLVCSKFHWVALRGDTVSYNML